MKILRMEQGTPEWEMARLGIPTASCYSEILTPAKLDLSKSGDKYARRLVAEWLVGYPIDWNDNNGFMDRGKEREAKARAWYEYENNVDVEQVGFLLRDDGMTGASPDGMVGESGLVEIKVPAIDTHLAYLDKPESIYQAYKLQVQGGLYISGREWCDVVSYHDLLPKVQFRAERDEEVISKLDAALTMFIAGLLDMRARWAPYKHDAPEMAAA